MSKLFSINILILLIFIPSLAHAGTKVWDFGWGTGHYDNAFKRGYNPYLYNGTDPQNNQYKGADWFAEDWLAQYENDLELIHGFYKADIFRDQEFDDDMPILVVGPSFYNLSGYDKRRTLHILDVVYNITKGAGAMKMFMLKDWRTDNIIGLYTRNGLQLQ